MAPLVDRLNELEKAVAGVQGEPLLAQLGKLPRLVAMLLGLLALLVHAAERQEVRLKNLERVNDGKKTDRAL